MQVHEEEGGGEGEALAIAHLGVQQAVGLQEDVEAELAGAQGAPEVGVGGEGAAQVYQDGVLVGGQTRLQAPVGGAGGGRRAGGGAGQQPLHLPLLPCGTPAATRARTSSSLVEEWRILEVEVVWEARRRRGGRVGAAPGAGTGFRKVCKTGKILPGQIQILWTILVRNNASVDIF